MPRGAIIPDPVDPAGTIRRVVCIPASPEWIAVVNGLLYPATQEWYWDKDTGDPAAAALRAQEMYFQFQDGIGPCDTMANVGDIKTSISGTPAAGWLLCDGTQYERTAYPELAALIPEGTPNIGGDATYFFVPNMSGRVIVGVGPASSWTPGRNFADIGGNYQHTLTVAEMPQHDHDTTTLGYSLGVVGAAGYVLGGAPPNSASKTGVAGQTQAHNNMQPFQNFYYHIYAGV
jgi:microcystin-dependent protein